MNNGVTGSWLMMLGGLVLARQTSGADCCFFDPPSSFDDGLIASEEDVGWREVSEALVVALNLTMSLRIVGCTTDMPDTLIVEPFGQIAGDAVLTLQAGQYDPDLLFGGIALAGPTADIPNRLLGSIHQGSEGIHVL